jgi:glutathione S-transferase
MLTLYHTPLSINSRRVWVAMLEKDLHFDTVEVDLAGDQFKPEFLGMNPFHHIPVLVDDGFTVIESLAILDYLEAKYPIPSLLPKGPRASGHHPHGRNGHHE